MNNIVEAILGITLMRYDNALGAHVQSGERKYAYYFQVPPDWLGLGPDALRTRSMAVASAIYHEHGDRMRRLEPNDINYLAVLGAEVRVLPTDEALGMPWLFSQPPTWESTCCALVNPDGSHSKVPAAEFPPAAA